MCTIFFPFLTLIKLSLPLSSSPLVLPHVSTWISLSTQGSSVFNKLKTHFNTADISRALRAFFIYRHNLNCSVETFQPCQSCSHRAALGVDRGQDRVLGVLPNGPLHWTCETLHLTQPLGTRLVCTCVHAGVCVYIVSKVTVLKVKNVGPLHAWQMDIFECKRENADKTLKSLLSKGIQKTSKVKVSLCCLWCTMWIDTPSTRWQCEQTNCNKQ